MGLFPETSPNGNHAELLHVAGTTTTPKGRRKLFVDLLSAVGGGSIATAALHITNSGSAETCNNTTAGTGLRLIPTSEGHHQSYPGIEGFISTTNHGAATIKNNQLASCHSAQQLSTSWEFLRPRIEPQQPQHHQQHQQHPHQDGIGKDEPPPPPLDLVPPRFIEVQKGKISLAPVAKPLPPPPPSPSPPPTFDAAAKDKEVLEARIVELEDSLQRLQKRVTQQQQIQCSSPTLEKDLRDQLDSMNRSLKSKERRAMQVCRDHKALQAKFQRQETSLQSLSTENQNLQQRVRQYECCLDDVMRKVVDALVAEDNLREEVSKLKFRVRDLEAQNAALSVSPVVPKGRDEGYCTMSSAQPPPCHGHLEDLPEEPEQMYMMAEPCSAEMEDWSMSQEELGAALEEDANESDWLWNSSSFLNSTVDSQSESISQLLENTIEYSEDEEIGCKNFTRDFYKLVNIASGSTRSLQSPAGQANFQLVDCTGGEADCDTDDSDDNSSARTHRLGGVVSPTPSEAGLAQVTSCSSSDASSDERRTDDASQGSVIVAIRPPPRTDSLLSSNSGVGGGGNNCMLRPTPRSSSNSGLHSFSYSRSNSSSNNPIRTAANRRSCSGNSTRRTADIQHDLVSNNCVVGTTQSMPAASWRSTGWRRVSSPQKIIESTSNNSIATKKDYKSPPPVPTRRSYAS